MRRILATPPHAHLTTLLQQLEEPAVSGSDLQQIVAMMPQPLFVKDSASRLVLMNPACEAAWGVRFADIAGSNGAGLYPADQLEIYHEYDRMAFEHGDTVVEEAALWHAGLQQTRIMLTYKHPTYDRDGRPHLLIGSCLDITERRQQERALEQALAVAQQVAGAGRDAVEGQHRRLAQTMQDDLAQNLLALKLDLTTLHARTGAAQPLLHTRATQALATLDRSIGAVRAIINELHPATLELGLCAAIEWQLQQMTRRQGLRCTLQVHADNAKLNPQQTSALFHVVQTGLEYLAGNAREIQVELDLGEQGLTIRLNSDYRATADAAPLNAMRQRLTASGGTLQATGNSLLISVPASA